MIRKIPNQVTRPGWITRAFLFKEVLWFFRRGMELHRRRRSARGLLVARGRSFVGRGRAHRRLTEWSSLAAQGYVTVAAAGATLISSVSFEDPGTIIRSRGIISVKPTTHNSDQDFHGAFGIGLVSAEALAVGVTALPEPFSDADWGGWMVWQPFSFNWDFSDLTGQRFGSIQMAIDSKAMRKVEPSSAMVFVAESFGGAFSITEQVRLLLKLP